MTWSFSIGRVLGSELRVHVTFLILLAWIAAAAYTNDGIDAAIWNTVFILSLFACVVAHEFGHALMARRYGIKTPDITLLPIGGLARLERMPKKPSAEIAVALAGPAVNLVIWAVLTLVFGADIRVALDPVAVLSSAGFLDQLALVNLYLLAFNLIPAFPMDGGRVLRAILSASSGRAVGTDLAVRIGKIFAVGLALFGLLGGNPFLVLIAAFVFFAGTAEGNDVAMRTIAEFRTAQDAMISDFRAIDLTAPAREASDAIIQTTQHEFPVVDTQGKPIGFLSRQTVFEAAANQKLDLPVAEIMAPPPATLFAFAPLESVIDELSKPENPAIFVVNDDNRLTGYITSENLAELMLLKKSV